MIAGIDHKMVAGRAIAGTMLKGLPPQERKAHLDSLKGGAPKDKHMCQGRELSHFAAQVIMAIHTFLPEWPILRRSTLDDRRQITPP
jgi:flagellar motor switch protein FliM